MAVKSPPGDDSPLRQGAGGDLLNPPEMGLAAAASLEGFPYRGSRYWGYLDEGYM